MPELGRAQEVSVAEERAADARPDCQEQHGARHALGGTEGDLGEAGRVGVVDEDDRMPDPLLQHLRRGRADPALVDVGCREEAPLLDHARQARAGEHFSVERGPWLSQS